MKHTLSVMVAATGMAVGLAAVRPAAAQQQIDPAQQPGVVAPGPRSPAAGVPSAAPRPTALPSAPSAGQTGHQIPIVQVPGVQVPGVQVPGPAPIVSVPPAGGVTTGGVTDATRTDLINRLVQAKYGPGVTVVNGQYVMDKSKMMMNGWGGGGWGQPMATQWVMPTLTTDGQPHGVYAMTDYQIAFAGNGLPMVQYGWDTSYGKYPTRMYRSAYSAWEDYDRYRNNPCAYNPYMVVSGGTPYLVDPRLTPLPADANTAPREISPLEKAEIALQSGDAAEAVKELKLHLKDAPDDAAVERLLAMALLDDHKPDQAIAVLDHAYMKQPQLARDPIDPRALSGGELEHRRRFTTIMDIANRTKTASSLFAAAVLAQSESRFDIAQKLLDRSVAAGLDKKIAEEMKLALANH